MAYAQSISFCGKIIETTVTSTTSVAENWLLKIRSLHSAQILIVGLNCKWKPHPIPSLSGKIATLQLCVDTKCLILQLLYMDCIPLSIKNFLSDPNVVFVGIEVEEIMSKLKNEYGLCIKKKIDVRTLAKLHFPISCLGKPGLKVLAYQLLRLRPWKPKKVCMNNLESGFLDTELTKFACIDAYVSCAIGTKLLLEETQ